MGDYDPIPLLENAGYSEQEAAFLYLVAVHSGYFLRRQFSRFIHRDRGKRADRFIQRALRLDHLHVIECGQGRHVYHLTSRAVYAAVLRADSQHRRFKGYSYLQTRLMVLDYVLDHLRDRILEQEAAKVEFFTKHTAIREELLPKVQAGRTVFFPDGAPIFVAADGTPQFTFFEDDSVTLSRFERFLGRYQPLFSELKAFELVYVSTSGKSFSAAGSVLRKRYTDAQVIGVTKQTPRGVEHFLKYLAVRQGLETPGRGIPGADLQILREGEAIYTSLEHLALYSAWKAESTNAELIRRRFVSPGPQAKFTTVVLPWSYPLFTLKNASKAQLEQGSRSWSPERSPSEKK